MERQSEKSSWCRASWLTSWSASLVLLAGLVGCQGQSNAATASGETPLIYSTTEYNRVVDQIEALSKGPLEKFYNQEPLEPEDRKALEDSLVQWQGLIAFAPTRFSNYFGAGQTAFVLEDYPAAIRYLNNAVNLAPVQPSAEETAMVAEAFFLVSRSSYAIQRFDQALTAAQEAQKRVPNSPDFVLAEARALAEMPQRELALAALERALKIDPNHEGSLSLKRFLRRSKPKSPAPNPENPETGRSGS